MPSSTPVARLSKREQIILLKASKLYPTHWFKPWDKDPSPQEHEGAEFNDDYAYQLSQFQSDILSGWQRPSLSPERWKASLRDGLDLVQDVTNDCSIVASFCVADSRAARVRSSGASTSGGPANIFSSVLFPFETPSPNGKYHVKLHFNGCERQVVIDDQLPVSRDGQYLHVTARDNPDAVWPALIEKAYLKVMGGYDFPGSDSATDLWVLAGWVPEQISLASSTVGPADLWRRVEKTFEYGDVMITLGTPKLSILEEKTYGLVSGHDYAVIDIKEDKGARKFLIKNPWSHASDHLRSNVDGLEAIPEDEDENTPISPVHAQANLQGTRWWDLHDVFRLFETAYLSWNPDIFKCRKDAHFEWDLTQRSAHGTFTHNPQYVFASQTDCTVWLVLSRHIDPAKRRKGGSNTEESGYVSLYAFRRAQRTVLNDGATNKTSYVNSQNVLLRLDIKANEPHVVVVSEQMIPDKLGAFSLSAFSTKPLQYLDVAPDRYAKMAEIEGSWAVSTAGGNANSQYFHLNPQFKLHVPQAGDIALLLATPREQVAVNVRVVWAEGKRIRPGLSPRDVFCSSGEYRRASALAEVKYVPPGTYTVVCSTFDKGQRAPFALVVYSTTSGCTIQPAASDEAGMFKFSLPPAVFNPGVDRVLCPIRVAQTSRIRVNAHAKASSKTLSPFSLALEYGQGPDKEVLATSGEPESQAKAAHLPETLIHAKWTISPTPGIWLVVERVGGAFVSTPEPIPVQILCTGQDFVAGPWGQEAEETIEELNRKVEHLQMHGSV